jgi:ribonuclease P protein component
VFERSRRLERPAFVVLWSPTPGKQQTGFTVSRQIRGAVKRNRARRRLREAYRHRTMSKPPDISVILIARPPVLTVAFASLVLAVDDMLRQLGRAVGR